MKYSIIKQVLIAAVLFFATSCKQKMTDTTDIASASIVPSFDLSNATLPGATVLTFGLDNVLFVGDSKSGVIHAIPTTASVLKDPVPFNSWGIDKKIADKLSIQSTDLIINDMKIHPVSQEAYIAVKNGHAPDAKSLIAIISPTNNDVRFLDVSTADKSQFSLQNSVTDTQNFWRDIPSNSLTITDMDYHNGHIYVAGLTNGEFASNLRKVAYPFTDTQTTVGSIEMFHTVHTQKETRAPIRTMIFQELNGIETLVAAYTCTPLVTIPSAEIKEGSHVKAKTIAELGYGNVPIDMLIFDAQDFEGNVDKKLLITHKNRSASLISIKDLAKANEGEGLTHFTQGPEGLNIFPVPLSGVMHIDDQNPMMLTVLRRNMENGMVDLLSEIKGSYFRLSDFINEYDFADYEYPKEAAKYKEYHNMARAIEGFPELSKE